MDEKVTIVKITKKSRREYRAIDKDGVDWQIILERDSGKDACPKMFNSSNAIKMFSASTSVAGFITHGLSLCGIRSALSSVVFIDCELPSPTWNTVASTVTTLVFAAWGLVSAARVLIGQF